jgi:hypothetical protein
VVRQSKIERPIAAPFLHCSRFDTHFLAPIIEDAMPISMPISTLTFAAPLLLAACATSSLPNPQIALIAQQIRAQSADYFTNLAAQRPPECDWEHNANMYAEIGANAAHLRAQLSASHASKPMIRSVDALAQAIDVAARSHQLASAITNDPHGPCLAPMAIALNADAIARASAAIAAAQQTEGASQ